MQFRERFDNHKLHDDLRALEASMESVDFDIKEQRSREAYDRFRRVIAHVRRRIDQADPELITPSMLKHLTGQLASVRAQHEQFKQSRNTTALNTHLDGLLDELYRWPAVTDATAEYRAVVEDLRVRSEQVVQDLSSLAVSTRADLEALGGETKENQTRLAQQDQRFEQQKGRVDQLITDLQEKFAGAQQQRLNEFNDAEKRREASVEEMIEGRNEEIDVLVEQRRAEMAEDRASFRADAEHKLEALNGHLEHASTIVGLIGNTGMTGHYQKVANREWWTAEVLRVVAFLCFLGTAGLVFWVVKDIGSADFTWEVALFRLGVSLTTLGPGVYCARESTRHRKHESRNRRIELELASIKPYLDDLPEERAQEVVEKMASRYFGNEIQEEPDRGSRVGTPREFVGLLERVWKLLERQ